MDKNEVYLCGIAGDDVKYGKAKNGKDYCTFSLQVVPYDEKYDSHETFPRIVNYIRIVVFNRKSNRFVDYLKSVGFHRGQRVEIFGWLSSRKTEIKGNNIIQISVVTRKIVIHKNKQNEE